MKFLKSNFYKKNSFHVFCENNSHMNAQYVSVNCKGLRQQDELNMIILHKYHNSKISRDRTTFLMK